ncbi:hypothetical protein CIB84_009457 [Bambusicola thoracicus]|uniref:TNFR-Cys domain-containing protein n=1 Tax=Bambusicola thoracicus TaxID=9083 RepID=A0A2P4SRQ5_BAMTH|nr:hypothetical protein CIB84_009457 [Bambusicola thoracicus]
MGMRAVGLLLLFSSSAGTYVAQHCSTAHSNGNCASCTEGKDYTAHANGLEECLLCRQCKDVVESIEVGKIDHIYDQHTAYAQLYRATTLFSNFHFLDQITSRTCTVTSDTECQCQQGYFCPAEGCEICQRCSQKCPEGREIVQICNATMDLGCGLPDQGLVHKHCLLLYLTKQREAWSISGSNI